MNSQDFPSSTNPETQRFIEISVTAIKQEVMDEDELQHDHYVNRSKPTDSMEDVNQYDNDWKNKPIKIELEEEIDQSDSSLTNKSAVDNDEMEKHRDRQKVEFLNVVIKKEVEEVHQDPKDTVSVEDRNKQRLQFVTVDIKQEIEEFRDPETESKEVGEKQRFITADIKKENNKESIKTEAIVTPSIHYDVLVTNEPVQCKFCNKPFDNSLDLLKHNREHLNVNITRAKINSKTSKYCINGKILSVVIIGKSFKCEHCNQIFRKYKTRREHIESVHSEKKLFCDLCGKQFICSEYVQKHMNLVHKPIMKGEKVKCRYCNGVFKHKPSLYAHIKRMHSGDTFNCVLCGAVFKSQHYLAHHVKNVHSTEEYKCKFCLMVFKSTQYLSHHIKEVHSEEKFKCEFCGSLVKSKNYLVQHIKQVHSTDEYNCDMCESVFKNRKYLAQHIKRHHSERYV